MLIAMSLVAATARADTLPEGERINIGTAEEKQCYDLEGYRALLKMAVDLDTLREQVILWQAKADAQQHIILDLREIDASQQDSIATLEAENERLFNLWKEENRLRHEAENVPEWGSWTGWVVAGVATLAAGGVLGYTLLND